MMRKTFYALIFFLLPLNAKCAEFSTRLSTPSAALYEILKQEKNDRGAFVKNISNDLKQCTNGRMLELKYLSVKASYWWDKDPDSNYSDGNINRLKPLYIDRKDGSSIYDREKPRTTYLTKSQLYPGNISINPNKFLNSEGMTREKHKFFYNKQYKDVESPLPKNIQSLVDYRPDISFIKALDTYPSVFHMIDVVKRLKRDELVEPTSCHASTKMIQSENPSSVIEEHIQQIFKASYFQDFAHQNHPLTHIIIDHLNKLLVFAQNNRFKASPNPEYKKSVMYDKIMSHIDRIIYLMSAFEMDLANKVSKIRGTDHWDGQFIPQNPYILYVQFYEIINDLLYLLMNLEDMYSTEDFDKILSSIYINRFPVLDGLQKNQDIEIHSFPARSGMEALVNSAMSIGYLPPSMAISSKVAGLSNTLYYEIDDLTRAYLKNLQKKWVFMFNTKVNEASLTKTRNSISKKYAENLMEDEIKQPCSRQIHVALVETYLPKKQAYDEMERYFQYSDDGQDSTEEDFSPQDPIGEYFSQNESKITEDYEKAAKYIEDKVFEEYLDINKDYKKAFSEQLQKGEKITAQPILLYLTNEESRNINVGAYHRMKQDLIEFITGEINKNIDFFLPFIKLKNGMEIIVPCEDIQSRRDTWPNNFLDFGDMKSFDALPGILSGMTTEDANIINIPQELEQLFITISSRKYIQEKIFSIKQPFVILWDTTVEVDDGPAYRMIEKFQEEIKSGEVIFILFKSLQKYANLGVGKTKAGAVTVIGKQSEHLTQILKNLKRYSEDIFSKGRKKDYSFMTFLYDRVNLPQGGTSLDNELLYYGATKQHAEKLAKDNPKYQISGGCLFSIGLPHNLPFADTFSFAIPTHVKIQGSQSLTRISVGLDPKGLEPELYAVPKSR